MLHFSFALWDWLRSGVFPGRVLSLPTSEQTALVKLPVNRPPAGGFRPSGAALSGGSRSAGARGDVTRPFEPRSSPLALQIFPPAKEHFLATFF